MSESGNPATPTVGDTHDWGSQGGSGSPRDLTGRTLGDFQVERMLGRGGMGEVYLARQISLNRPVALKVLRPDLLTNPTYLGRFESEATAVAKLNHPNIVHIYMLGHVEGIRFIVMEYVQGTNLREYLQKKGALDLPLALSIMKQAAVAIGAAGELGLIHRDIKPENLLLTRKGQVKVADFGLCRDQDADRLHLTQTGVTLGTPQYMSPEQAQGLALDHRSDLYSLGVTFYHMLSGSPPFRAETALAMALKHVKDTPVSLTVHRPEIPAELDRLVLKLMAKDPAERYQSAAEVLRDLARVREALNATSVAMPEAFLPSTANGTSVTFPPATARVAKPRPGPEEGEFAEPHPAPGRRGWGGLVAAALAAGLAWGWFSRPPDLLAEASPQPDVLPALWMSPEWQAIEKQPSAEAQYHYAQLQVAAADQEAAWLAVPGYHPASREWAPKAYIQLARALLRRHDLDRLKVFAAELARWNPERMHEKELAVIVQAAADALDGNIENVIDELGTHLDLKTVIDPALLGLALEVTTQAAQAAQASRVEVPAGLREIQARLAARFSPFEFREPLGRGRPG